MKKCNYLKKIKICFLDKDNENKGLLKQKLFFREIKGTIKPPHELLGLIT